MATSPIILVLKALAFQGRERDRENRDLFMTRHMKIMEDICGIALVLFASRGLIEAMFSM